MFAALVMFIIKPFSAGIEGSGARGSGAGSPDWRVCKGNLGSLAGVQGQSPDWGRRGKAPVPAIRNTKKGA